MAFSILLAVYALIFWFAEGSLEKRTVILAIIPVIGGSWYLGVWGGILSTTLALLLSALLFELKGYSNAWAILVHEGGPGSAALYLVAVILGYLSFVKRRYEEAVRARARLAEKTEAQVSSLSNLVNITNRVLDAENLNTVLTVLAEETSQIFGADDCLICLWDEASSTYYPRVAVGNEKVALENLPPRPENNELVLLQNADILTFGKLEELSDTWQFFMTVHPQGDILALPLGANGEKIGILQLLYEFHHEFDPDELAYAKLISRQISQAILKLILLTHAEEQVEELSILHQVAVILPRASDSAALVRRTLTVLKDTHYPERLSIVIFDEHGEVVDSKGSIPLGENEVIDLISLGKGITGRVAKTGLLERHDDVRKVPGYAAINPGTRSEICVPIKLGEQVWGVINVESDRYAAFDVRDERILTTVANQMGVALKRLRAEQAQQERVAEIDRSNKLIHALTQVATKMEMSSDPNAVMRQLGDALQERNWKVLVALFESGSQNLMIRYTSIDPKIVRKAERFGKMSMQDFRIPLDALPELLNLKEHLHPVILNDYIAMIARLLDGFTPQIMQRIFNSTLDIDSMVLGHFPLMHREKILGFLWLWGEDLRYSDLPTLSVFANQVAATLENAQLFADVQRLAVTDGLTQLYTRRHFFELAYEEFYRARRYGRALSLIMFDLDHFKRVNDTYGHSAGDVVLAKTAAACRESLRANDIIGRYGGEEIVILLVETDRNAAQQVARRICKKIRELVVSTPKGDVHITISGGVAGDNVEDMNLIEMIEAADSALYRAKVRGRDRVEVYSATPVGQDE